MGQPHSPLPRTIKKPELRQMVPLADSTIWEMEQRGEFPKRFRLTPRCVVWDLSEVQTWLEKRRRTPVTPAPITPRPPRGGCLPTAPVSRA